jgi:hypothetical protein
VARWRRPPNLSLDCIYGKSSAASSWRPATSPDHAALSGLDEHPLGLRPCLVGVADDHQQECAVDGKVADRHSQQFGPDRANCVWEWRNLILRRAGLQPREDRTGGQHWAQRMVGR